MDRVIFFEKKVEQYEKDLKLILDASKKLDKIKTPTFKIKFDDLVIENIKDISERISNLKDFLTQEKDESKVEGEE